MSLDGFRISMIPAQVRAPLSVVAWIACSSGLILFNKQLLAGWFPFPIVLTLFHMLFASLVTWSLRFTGVVSTKLVSWPVYRKMFIPIAALFALSLILSNYAYLYLSVSFIQMLKASTPIVVLTLSIIFGVERKITPPVIFVVITVCFGVFLAAYGELLWSTVGVALQVGGILVEASRLVTIQLVLKEISLGPLDSLTLYAPACAVFLFIASIFTGEIYKAAALQTFYPIQLLGNVIVAFALNLVTLWLVTETSSLVLTMCGIVKDILLIFLSKLIFKSYFTRLQVVGYTISLVAIYVFNQLRMAAPPPAPLDTHDPEGRPVSLLPAFISHHFPWLAVMETRATLHITRLSQPLVRQFPVLSTVPSRHYIVGSIIVIFFISGMLMSDTRRSDAKTEPTLPPYWKFLPLTPEQTQLPPTELPSCRKQPKVRISVEVLEMWTGGIEAMLQLMIMVQDLTPLLPFPAIANSLLPLEIVHRPYAKRYAHDLQITYSHVPIDELGKEDDIFEIILVPEGHDCHGFMAPQFPLLTPTNTQVFMWQLASHPINPSCHYFVHADWFRTEYNMSLPTSRLVRPYLSKDNYQPAMDVGFLHYNGSINTRVAQNHKKNIILVDNDTPDEITAFLLEQFMDVATVTVVTGFSISELHFQYIQAKVVVDWCLVGAERVPIEASLFGAVFISSRCVGYPEMDFPVGNEFFLETKEEMVRKIHYTLSHWSEMVHKQDELRRNALTGKATMRSDTFTFLKSITPPLCETKQTEKEVKN